MYVLASSMIVVAIWRTVQTTKSPGLYIVVFSFQALYYGVIPFVSLAMLEEVLLSDDVPVLFSETSRFDPYFKLKCKIITRLNLILTVFAFGSYCVLGVSEPIYIGSSAFFTFTFFIPFVLALSVALMLTEGFRLQSVSFIAQLKNQRRHQIKADNENVGDVELPMFSSDQKGLDMGWRDLDMIRRYYALHARCMYTSERRGKLILCLFLYSVLNAIGSAYGALTRQYDVLSISFFTTLAVFIVLEIGISVASVNEMATLVCRELCTSQLCYISHASMGGIIGNDTLDGKVLQRFFSCMVYSKLEISFVGNFALRSNTLIAVLGSILAAILPSIIANAS